jgi:thiosulfate dehydrogenase [quinone] large subunit
MSTTQNENATRSTTVPHRNRNGWSVVPLRLFLGSLFVFAGYAKLSFASFFDPESTTGLRAIIDSVKPQSPIGAALGPLASHPALFGYFTAFAEIAIGLGLLTGLLIRIAALGGMALTGLIVLSVNWSSVREYTASGGWFTSVDLAVAAGLSVFLLGGAGPFSLDSALARVRARRDTQAADEPRLRDGEWEESRGRLQGGTAEPVTYPTAEPMAEPFSVAPQAPQAPQAPTGPGPSFSQDPSEPSHRSPDIE